MEMQDVCYTREAALEKAIEMEMISFQTYKKAYFSIKDRRAKELAKEIALDELDHKHTLEKSFFEEAVALHDEGMAGGPSMNLSIMLQDKPISAEATDQSVMAYAIHEKKRTVDFYKKLAKECAGAPQEDVFKRLSEDEEDHLSRLEEIYENIYMKEM